MAHETLVLDAAQSRALLPMRSCMEVMRSVFAALAVGDAQQPLRTILWLDDKRGGMGMMPGALPAQNALGVKAVTVFPSNSSTTYETHQGVILLHDMAHGLLRAIVDAGVVTAIRTAAVSALATDLLARKDARTLAILGAGTQARAHLEAMLFVRPFERVQLWSLHSERAQSLSAWADRSIPDHPPIELCDCAQTAIENADVVCTLTASHEPIVKRQWLAPGAHINAVGACTPDARELDSATVAQARVIVDRLESALMESGDVRIPIAEGAFDASHIAGELGDVVTGACEGRRTDDELTIFDSLGLAVEDVAAAQCIYEQALAQDVGVRVRFATEREP